MSLLQALLRITNFKTPLGRTLVPCAALAFGLQAAFAVPSCYLKTDRFYDFSGAVTNVAVVSLSLYLPALRARYAAGGSGAAKPALPGLLAPFTNQAAAAFNWRQVALSAAAAIWATRLGIYLFQRVLKEGKDSRFDKMKHSPGKFFVAWMVQAAWSTLILLPIVALNAVPASALAAVPAATRATDVLGLGMFVGGLALEIAADRQKQAWVAEKKAKLHDERFMTRGLWSRSQYPNYFGEVTLWTGIATTAAGALVTAPAQAALGLGGGLVGRLGTASLALASPAFTAYILLRLSGVPMSEKKYDKLYGDRQDYQEWKKTTPKFFPKLF